MGAWFVRDSQRPHFVGFSQESLVAAIKAVPHMKEYIRSNFSLKSGEYPHAMKF